MEGTGTKARRVGFGVGARQWKKDPERLGQSFFEANDGGEYFPRHCKWRNASMSWKSARRRCCRRRAVAMPSSCLISLQSFLRCRCCKNLHMNPVRDDPGSSEPKGDSNGSHDVYCGTRPVACPWLCGWVELPPISVMEDQTECAQCQGGWVPCLLVRTRL